MKLREANLPIDFLRDVLLYEPTTGIFICKKKYANKILVGSVVGANHLAGYKQIMLQRTQFLAHRLAWFYVYGCWPKQEIDHIDGNRSNNAISNLRDVDRLTNAQNKRCAQSDNSSGFLGVHAKRGRWVADIKVKGKTMRVGTFDTPQEASEAFLNAKRIHHAGCTI
jgi:hypothetical protein